MVNFSIKWFYWKRKVLFMRFLTFKWPKKPNISPEYFFVLVFFGFVKVIYEVCKCFMLFRGYFRLKIDWFRSRKHISYFIGHHNDQNSRNLIRKIVWDILFKKYRGSSPPLHFLKIEPCAQLTF